MTLEAPGSVTHWLQPLQAGDPAAAEFLWDRYFEQVLQLARRQLLGVRDRSREAEVGACYPIALEQAEWLLAREPGEPRWRRQLVELGIHLADLSFVSGDVSQARDRLEAARPLALSLVETEPVEAVDRHA